MAGLARVLLVAASLCLAVPAGAAGPRDTSAYQGLGTWVDIWDGAQWAKPEAAVARMRDLGVTTLYLETSNYSQAVDLLRPAALGRFVDAAHANGLRIVAWYLPSFANVARDLRRSLAAVRFRSPKGEAFDSFALDIEAKVVPSAAKRSVRLLGLSRALRKAVGPDYPLGAIIPAPRGMELNPKYWPRFPYEGLAKTYDVFMPMGYFTYRDEDGAGDAGIHAGERRDCCARGPATRALAVHARRRAGGQRDGRAGARFRGRSRGRGRPRREPVRLRDDERRAMARAQRCRLRNSCGYPRRDGVCCCRSTDLDRRPGDGPEAGRARVDGHTHSSGSRANGPGRNVAGSLP